jgi:hypothetical protein
VPPPLASGLARGCARGHPRTPPTRRGFPRTLTAVGLGALGVAAAVFGEADDAPGLVLLGILLVGSGCAIGLRAARA